MGFFKSLFSSKSSQPTITTVSGSRVIYGVKNLNKNTLFALQSLCLPGAKKLILNTDKVIATCDSILTQHMAIVEDCKDLINKTDNPGTFFSRYDLLIEHLQTMADFEPYIQFYGYQPIEAIKYYLDRKNHYTNKMIDRRYNKALIKADSLKTEKGKKNQFIKAYEELKGHSSSLSSDNLKYLENKFKNKL